MVQRCFNQKETKPNTHKSTAEFITGRDCALIVFEKGTGHFLTGGHGLLAVLVSAHSCAAQDIKWFAALMEIMVQWVGYKRDDCSQNNL